MSELKFEMHFHTDETSPCGQVLAKDGIKIYQEAGYDGVVVTDHFNERTLGNYEDSTWEECCENFLVGYKNAKNSIKDREFKVLLGMEIRFPDNMNDFLVYGIDEQFLYDNPWLYMKNIEYLYSLTEKYNIVIVQAHPFRLPCFIVPVEFLHGVEVFNGNPRHESRNELAEEVAKENNLLKLIGSDFHRLGDVSNKPYIFSKMPEDEQNLANLLKNNLF